MTITAQLADGRMLEFPDGTDPTVVQATVKKMVRPAVAQEKPWNPLDDMSGTEKFLAGAGKRMTDILTLGGAAPWLPHAGEGADKSLMATGAGAAGGVLTDLATTLVPGVGAAKALQATRLLRPFGTVGSSLAANAGVSGAIGFGTTRGDIGERAKSGLADAALSVGGELGLRGLGRVIGGPLAANKVTPEAKRLLDEGVPVPPWKASDSPRLRDFGERAKASVIGKPFMADAERRAFTEYNRNLVKSATPPSPVLDDAGNVLRWESKPITEVSDNSLNLLKGRFSEAYDTLYKGRAIPIDDVFNGEVKDTVEAVSRYYPHLSGEVKGIVNKVDDILAATKSSTSKSQILNARGESITKTELGHAGVPNDAVKSAIDVVQDAITTAYRAGNGDKAEALSTIADALRGVRERGLPPEVQSMAKDVNSAYTNFLQLQKAHAMMGAQKSGLVSPRQMLSSAKALDRSKDKAAFARGNLPNQSSYVNAERVLGSDLPEVGPGTAEKLLLAGALGSPFMMMGDVATGLGAAALATPGGQRYMFGLSPLQRQVRAGVGAAAPYSGQAVRGILSSLVDD